MEASAPIDKGVGTHFYEGVSLRARACNFLGRHRRTAFARKWNIGGTSSLTYLQNFATQLLGHGGNPKEGHKFCTKENSLDIGRLQAEAVNPLLGWESISSRFEGRQQAWATTGFTTIFRDANKAKDEKLNMQQ